MISFFNKSKGGSGGDGTSQNIFCQLDEPTIKKGIWLQAEREIEHITTDEEIFIAGTWADDGIYSNIPYNFYGGASTSIGTNIYLFGSNSSSSYYKYAYKYDTLTDTFTRLTDLPINVARGAAISVNTDIYIFSGTSACKYDTLTDTYTQLANIPYNFTQGIAALVGTDIHLFSGNPNTGNNTRNHYKYDTLTNTYTQLGVVAYPCYGGSAQSIGTNVYLFGSGYSGQENYAYKYDALTDTYTRLKDIPFTFQYGAITKINTDIYLLGGHYSLKTAYKYNTITDTYTQIPNIPLNSKNSAAAHVGSNIYLLGSESTNYTKNQVYNLESKTYSTNTLVIAQGKYKKVGYEIELYSNEKNQVAPIYAFADAWFYSNQLETNIPTYYGDGTNWNKIKN